MRHQKNKITLDRKSAARRSLFANLTGSLILFERVQTTMAKAKAVRSLAEKIITKAKKQNLSSRRDILKVLYSESVIRKLFEVIAPRYNGRSGGYVRITATQNRKGDGAQKAVLELI